MKKLYLAIALLLVAFLITACNEGNGDGTVSIQINTTIVTAEADPQDTTVTDEDQTTEEEG